MMRPALSFLVFLVLVGAAATSGAQFTTGAWYESLNKPSWTPPNWLFPIAWSVLYLMIAIAGWLIWRRFGVNGTLVVWAIGLVLNALWSYLMFGRHDIAGALLDVAALWISVALFIVMAWSQDQRASYLFMPYLVWVSFASALNFAVWRLNS